MQMMGVLAVNLMPHTASIFKATRNWAQLQLFPGAFKEFAHIALMHNFTTVRIAYTDLKLKVVMGSCCLGGIIGVQAAFDTWIQEKTRTWTLKPARS
jgi:hypothetical protein